MSRKEKTGTGAASAFVLAEEAVQLLIAAGFGPAAVYAIGSLPFVVGLVAYTGAMTHSGYAYQHVGTGALGLALLFMWMKAVQARFAQHLLARLRDETPPAWGLATFFAVFCRQGLLHASVVIVYPVAFITVLPMGFAAATYQNASILDNGTPVSTRELAGKALAQARLWPKQNHILLWLCSPLMVVVGAAIALGTFPLLDTFEDEFMLSLGGIYATILLLAALPVAPFAVFIVANIASALFFAIELFHVFTGADTVYARSPNALLGNDLFIAIACGAAYLLLDPVLKAAYAIRCHEGDSLETGADLRVALRRIRQGAACFLVVAATVLAMPGQAQEPPEAPQTPQAASQTTPLNQAIDEELAGRRYQWRMPREPQPQVELPWLLQMVQDFGESVREWLKAAFRFVADTIETIWDWFFGGGESESPSGVSSPTGVVQSLRVLVGVLAAVLLAALAYLLWQTYQSRRPKPLQPMSAAERQSPDLEDESTTAADLPDDQWRQLARELAAKGDFRLAARALFFSTLATLARHEVIRLARFKSNMDYEQELARRAATIGTVPATFSKSALLYEAVWYGTHEATEETVRTLYGCQEEMRHGLQ